MADSFARPLARLRAALGAVSLGQKIAVVALAVAVIFGGFFFVRWITAPTYAPLFSSLSSADAAAIVEELNASATPYELADGGQTIMVPRDKVYDLRLQMSSAGLPAGNETGYALLDKQGITTSEFQQNIDYQRALEGEMASTLGALDGVQTAVVHIALPKKDVFATDAGKPTASVLLDLAAGKSLSAGQVQAVTHLVSSSVQDMTPEQVTVADSTGKVLSAAGSDAVSAGAADAQSQMTLEVEKRLAANAQEMLDRVVGPGMAVVKVSADLDFDRRDTTSETFQQDPNVAPLSETTTTENYEGTGAPVGGVLGPENQVQAPGTGNSTYDKETTTRNNSVGKTTETVKAAPGAVERLTVSVLMDQRAGGVIPNATVQDVVGSAVGLDADRGDVITVAEAPFDTTAQEAAAAEMAAAKAAADREQMMSLIRTGAILGFIALLLLIAWIRSRRKKKTAAPYPTVPLKWTPEQEAELERVRIEVTSRQALELEAPSDEEVQRRTKIREEISDMVSAQPDEVAVMLRMWMTEAKA